MLCLVNLYRTHLRGSQPPSSILLSDRGREAGDPLGSQQRSQAILLFSFLLTCMQTGFLLSKGKICKDEERSDRRNGAIIVRWVGKQGR